MLAAAGVPTDPERAALGEAVEAVMARLAPVRQDAALMLHAEHRPDAEVVAHLRRWLLVDEARARRMLEFLAHPRWRTHTTTYVEGARLLRPWLLAGVAARIRSRRVSPDVLDDPPTPAALRGGPLRRPRAGPPLATRRLAALAAPNGRRTRRAAGKSVSHVTNSSRSARDNDRLPAVASAPTDPHRMRGVRGGR